MAQQAQGNNSREEEPGLPKQFLLQPPPTGHPPSSSLLPMSEKDQARFRRISRSMDSLEDILQTLEVLSRDAPWQRKGATAARYTRDYNEWLDIDPPILLLLLLLLLLSLLFL